MQPFRRRFQSGTEKPIEQRFQEFLFGRLAEVPAKFRGRYHGPVLALPRFMHKWVYWIGPEQPKVRFESFQYKIVDGYELAAIIFFPETAGLHDGAVHRIEFEFTALDYETTKQLSDGE